MLDSIGTPDDVNESYSSNSGNFLLPLLIGTLFILMFVGFYFSKDSLFKTSPKQDPTINKQSEETHASVWLAYFQIDTEKKIVTLVGDPQISNSDLFVPILNEKPKLQDNEWTFQVVIENDKAEIVYRSFRKMTKLPLKDNPKVWEFAVAVPYKKGDILRILDEEGSSLYIGEE